MNLDHLQSSYKRLSELIKLGSPSILILEEFRVLSHYAFLAIREVQSREVKKSKKKWRNEWLELLDDLDSN